MAAEVKLVVFELAGEQFAAPIERVIEIHRPQRLTRMPRTPGFVVGIFNLRGRVLPVIDAKARLGIAPREAAPLARALKSHEIKGRVMVVEAMGEHAGMVVDAVHEVLACPAEALQSPEGVMGTAAGQFLKGVVEHEGRMILVLDLDRLLSIEAEGSVLAAVA